VRSVIVTGASTGIGRDVLPHLKNAGFTVIPTARKPVDVDTLKQEGWDHARQLDMSDAQSILQLIKLIERDHPSLFGIFSNAGYGQPGAVEDLPTISLREQFETNFFGVHTLVSGLLPLMRTNGGGRIVVNSSVLGFAAMPYRAAYNSSKAALESWASTLRLETIDDGIHVSIVQPGPISTMFRKNSLAALNQNIDIHVSVHAKNYARMIARLSSDKPVPFTLPAASVSKQVLHAMTSRKPRRYYRITVPTKLSWFATHFLPASVCDLLFRKGF